MTATRFSGLIFDIGDTLFDATPWRRWLTVRLRLLGAEITYPELVTRWEVLLVDVYRGRAEYWQRFGELLASLDITGEPAETLIEQARECGQEVVRSRRLFDGVAATLKVLKAMGVRVAALSDTESTAEKVRRGLDALGIVRYFDAVLTSVDIGYVKPQAEAYLAAANAIGLTVAQCAFVGHDTEELAGARAAGMFAVAYNHDSDAPADMYLEHFDSLLDLVVSIE